MWDTGSFHSKWTVVVNLSELFVNRVSLQGNRSSLDVVVFVGLSREHHSNLAPAARR